MAQYKKLSDYTVEATPNNGDLVPLIVDNGDGTYDNALMTYESIKGAPGTNGTNGQGVIPGGTTYQVLAKTSGTDYATQWKTIDKTAVGLPNVDNTTDLAKPVSTATQSAINAAVANVMLAIYPVGSLYFNASDSTNPATLLGFGTWVAYAQGQVPVGKADSGTFSTAGNTGGAETHTLTEAQLPYISGSFSIHGQENGTLFAGKSGYATGTLFSGKYGNLNYYNSSQSYTNPGFAFGQGQAHNNLQPYVVVYIWKRTA